MAMKSPMVKQPRGAPALPKDAVHGLALAIGTIVEHAAHDGLQIGPDHGGQPFEGGE